jgi:hypothetical protein
LPFDFCFADKDRATLATELGARRILKATLRTATLEGCSTLITELHSIGILKCTAWALHVACLLLRVLRGKVNAYWGMTSLFFLLKADG